MGSRVVLDPIDFQSMDKNSQSHTEHPSNHIVTCSKPLITIRKSVGVYT